MEQKIIFTNYVESELDKIVTSLTPSGIFILVDDNTIDRVLPRLQSICTTLKGAYVINIKPGDENKNLETLRYIWKELSDNGANRKSLLINLGGGMVTDIGAFAASTFKRGMSFINIPTTLLGAVDAAIGGKTGFNFNGLKNEIGMFSEANYVIISTIFLATLPSQEIRAGYAEMIKHGIISDQKTFTDLLKRNVTDCDPNELLKLVEESTKVKADIVGRDPHEKNIRKALNFGHTVGHSFEAFAIKRGSAISHGYAVAFGMVVETVLSVLKQRFPTETMRKLATYIYANYGAFRFSCEDYDELIELMRHDKKNNTLGKMNFTLLENVGNVVLDCSISSDEIKAAFDIYREELCK